MLKLISLAALVLTVAPSLFYLTGTMTLDTTKTIALVGTVAWFATTPLWMGREESLDGKNVQI